MGRIEELQQYKFISIQAWCCTESAKMSRILPLLFPNHYIEHVNNPIRKIDFNQKVKMGELESQIYKIISDIEENIIKYDKYCIDIIPLLNINWM